MSDINENEIMRQLCSDLYESLGDQFHKYNVDMSIRSDDTTFHYQLDASEATPADLNECINLSCNMLDMLVEFCFEMLDFSTEDLEGENYQKNLQHMALIIARAVGRNMKERGKTPDEPRIVLQ